jgi:hypothetical protein
MTTWHPGRRYCFVVCGRRLANLHRRATVQQKSALSAVAKANQRLARSMRSDSFSEAADDGSAVVEGAVVEGASTATVGTAVSVSTAMTPTSDSSVPTLATKVGATIASLIAWALS